jgi:isochorismate synthase
VTGRGEIARGPLREAVAAAAEVASRRGHVQLVTVSAELPHVDGLAAFDGAGGGPRFFWERPETESWMAAFGCARAIETSGPGRFRQAGRRARELFARLHRAGDPPPPAAGPLLVGGFAFDESDPPSDHWSGFPAGRLVLPELLFAGFGGRAWCTVTHTVEPGVDVEEECAALRAELDTARHWAAGDPWTRGPLAPAARPSAPEFRLLADHPNADYRARVAVALDAIAAGDLEKVVLARSIRLLRREGFGVAALLASLREAHPSCATFAVAGAASVFLGATPERLVRVAGRRVEATALAGSAPRGRNPEEDGRLGRALRESKKEQAEHTVVVRALRAALSGACHELEIPEAPRLLRLEGIQHLETPVSGALRAGSSIFDLLERLHPTPAVAGAPREEALAWLARVEDLDRGWYGGPVGFVDAEGGGEFCVALRSALLRGGEAKLFAGAGVVAGSTPEGELRETRLKLHTLLTPLLEV